MVKFIHTADIHLGLRFNSVSFDKNKAMDRRRELWDTFQRIVEYCIQKNADFLLIAGDLFEASYFTLGDIKRVRDIFSQAENVNILISAGNHDVFNSRSLYNKIEWSNNVTIFGSNGIEYKDFRDLNTRIYGYSWDCIEINENHLLDEPTILDKNINNILIIHGDINKESRYLPMQIEKLKALNMDYVALGHIHKPNMFSHKIAYSGCPEPLDFGEKGVRGIIEGTIENGKTNTHFIPFSKRYFYEKTIELDENMGYLDILNKIQDVDEGNPEMDFYRIRLTGYIQKDIELIDMSKDLDNVFYHIEITNETTPDYDLNALENGNRENIIGLYIKAMKEKNFDNELVKDALYLGLEALLKERN